MVVPPGERVTSACGKSTRARPTSALLSAVLTWSIEQEAPQTGVAPTDTPDTSTFGALARAVQDLDDWLRNRDLCVEQIVGRSADALESYFQQNPRPGRWRDFVPPEAR